MKKTTVDEPEGVVLGKWRGYRQYTCSVCGWDTLDRAKFIDHFATLHPPLEVIEGFKEAPPAEGETFVGGEG